MTRSTYLYLLLGLLLLTIGFYPTDPIGVGRACPGDREIRRRETVRREERS